MQTRAPPVLVVVDRMRCCAGEILRGVKQKTDAAAITVLKVDMYVRSVAKVIVRKRGVGGARGGVCPGQAQGC